MTSQELLRQLLSSAPSDSLWCLGENSADSMDSSIAVNSLCNRFDLCQQLSRCEFSDFDFSAFADNSLRAIFFRIEKEKALNIHIIQQALVKLHPNGVFHLIGYKNEGIESLDKLISQHSDALINKKKHKQLQHLQISKPTQCTIANDYHTLQLFEKDDFSFLSKPGVFGWQKIDAGSQLLMNNIAQHGSPDASRKVLDIGCGYGYLSLRASALGFEHIDASDNNAAALIACQANFERLDIKGRVFADNIAQGATSQHYDLVLCNPPFHQGFAHSKQLIHDFCQQAHRCLKTGGTAWFVVNQFVGIEAAAKPLFKQVELIQQEQGFKILRCQK